MGVPQSQFVYSNDSSSCGPDTPSLNVRSRRSNVNGMWRDIVSLTSTAFTAEKSVFGVNGAATDETVVHAKCTLSNMT